MKKQTLFDLVSMPKMVLIIVAIVLFGTWLGAVGYLMSVSKTCDPIIPVSKTEIIKEEAISLVKKRCENEKNDYVYSYNNIKKTDNEWRIPIMNVNCLCYAVVDVKTGEVDCIKEISFSQKKVTITTDKMEYEQGEDVKIIVENNLDENIYYYENIYCYLEYKKENKVWIESRAINMPCLKGETKEIKNSKAIYFNVNFSRDGSSHYFGEGRYRVVFKYDYKSNTEDYIIPIYSNEFTIKEKSVLDSFLPDEEELTKCNNNSDCILLDSFKCDCSMRPTKAINKKYLDVWNKNYANQECFLEIVCPAAMEIFGQYETECENNKCVVVEK